VADRPVKVLFVHDAPYIGGSETVLLDLLSALNRERFEPVVATSPRSALIESLDRAGVPWRPFELPQMKSFRGLFAAKATASRLTDLVASEKARLVHTNTVRAHIAGALSGGRADAPVVWHLHDDTMPRWAFRLLHSRATRILAASRFIASFYRAADLPGCRVVHNGIDPGPSGDAARFRSAHGVPPEAPLVISASRLARWKGQRTFLESAAQVALHRPDAWFAVVGGHDPEAPNRGDFGGGPEYAVELEKLAGELGIEASVVFTGHLPQVDDAYAAADLLVHSPTRPEPFGQVLVEAMAAGLPVIASRLGGPSEIVVEGETGRLVEAGNAAAFAAAIVELLDGVDLRRTMGEAGRRRAREHFDLHAQTRKVEAVFDEALNPV
jgi:glycosyltransferase involved in cell wall biosynthesis